MKNQKKIKKRGFTLIETLIILGVLAILGTITAIVINPIERLRTARDTNRFADLRSVQKTLSLFKIDNPNLSFGSSSVVYVSLPDTDPNCSSWDLPPLPSGWSYSCKDQTNYKKVDGTGWIPVNLTVSTSNLGSGLSILPVDSANNSNNYFFYIYDPSSGTFELGATLEAERNKIAALNDGGVSPEFWELGTNLALYPTNSPYVLVKNESDHQVYNENNFKMYAYAASAGQVSFFTDTNKITGDNNFFWNNSTKYLGIGTNGPNYKLDVQGGQVNASGGLCINGNCKTDWNILWSTLTSFPSACPSGQYVSAVSSTLTCSTPSQVGGSYWLLSGSNLYASSTSWNVAVGTASPDANYKITTSGGGIKAESTSQPAGYFSSASGYGLLVNNGNVGIGITTPAQLLDVDKSQNASTLVRVGNSNITGTAALAGFNYAASTAAASFFAHGDARTVTRYGITLAGYNEFLSYQGNGLIIGTGGTATPVIFGTNNIERLRIDSAGNVGIGTASPGTKLDVSGTARMTGFQLGTTSTAGYVLTTNASGVGTWQAASSLPSGTSGQTLRHNGTTWVANSVIYNNGTNVGIGTTAPSFPLHVLGTAVSAIAGEIYSGASGTALSIPPLIMRAARGTLASPSALQTNDILFSIAGRGYGATGFTAESKAVISAQAAQTWTDSAQGTYIAFRTTPIGSTAIATAMTILGSGNVGIGTVSPGTTLDVNGTARMTGFQLGTTATAGYVLTTNASGVGTWQALPGGGIGGSGTLNYIPKFTAATTLGNSQIYDSGTNVGIGTATPGQKLTVAGTIQSTTGGFMFPDSTIQTTTAVSFANMQAFTSSGTWTRPANVSKVYVRVWGGGGGGRGSTSNGGAGSGSAFGGSVTAGGGSGGTNIAGGAGGTASAGTLRLSGGVGGFGYANEGGGSPLGASGGGSGVAGGIPGGGGGGYSSSGTNGAGGGGAYAEGTVTVTGNVTVTIGSGGAAGSAGAGAGASGLVIVYW
jgi:type II secretory pathway pseudopilin PulG